MNQIANRGTAIGTDLVNKLKSGIAESRANTIIAGGKPLLRLLKDANWVYGQKDDPVQEGSSWAVNTLSLSHGWVAWTNHEGNQKNTMVGENMVPIHEPKPPRPAPVEGWPFSEQRLFELRCMDGDDQGMEVLYKSASYGGMQAVDKLLGAIQAQLNDNPIYPCPVVILLSDSYQHQKWGKVYNPVFDIIDWATMDGRLMSEEEQPALADAAAPPAPAPRRTRVVAVAPAPDPEDLPWEAPPVPQPAPAPQPAPVPRAARRAAAAQAAPAAAPAPSEPEPTARRRPIRRG